MTYNWIFGLSQTWKISPNPVLPIIMHIDTVLYKIQGQLLFQVIVESGWVQDLPVEVVYVTESNSKYFDKKTAGGALFPPGTHTRSDETFEELLIKW